MFNEPQSGVVCTVLKYKHISSREVHQNMILFSSLDSMDIQQHEITPDCSP